jgi:mono/diheme cytochrome c family protein
MRLTFIAVGASLLVLALAGCGGKSTSGDAGTATAPSAGGEYVVPADLDQGPRAGNSPVDEARAAEGEQLFSAKGCTACHGFGRRISGPDLNGVTLRRTTRWMESQILHPDQMTRQDPTARSLFATYSLQMPNQGLTPDQVKAVVEFLKMKNRETR